MFAETLQNVFVGPLYFGDSELFDRFSRFWVSNLWKIWQSIVSKGPFRNDVRNFSKKFRKGGGRTSNEIFLTFSDIFFYLKKNWGLLHPECQLHFLWDTLISVYTFSRSITPLLRENSKIWGSGGEAPGKFFLCFHTSGVTTCSFFTLSYITNLTV